MNAFNMIIIKNYFQSLPMELEEAAIIDGSNDLLTFIRIILPLSTTVLASVVCSTRSATGTPTSMR